MIKSKIFMNARELTKCAMLNWHHVAKQLQSRDLVRTSLLLLLQCVVEPFLYSLPFSLPTCI